LLAIDRIAAHSESYSPPWSTTIRTARSRTSGENFDTVLIAPSSQRMEPRAIPVRFTIFTLGLNLLLLFLLASH
jgi:hypothetical protein